ncbi:ATP-binding protein [Dokdonella sp.]|uniref:sensor histidine kinase n=1 Tax=Dokdonella sp. TaxID=2291710 RepID=UPI001B1427A7|nr:ATP-binding protein [Dokdonella sp.]MBO9664181.1 histidine kinase [Dokdonella sp.]
MSDLPSPPSIEGAPSPNAATAPPSGPAGWLWRAPIADPVDRRNAPMLQVVLLILGSLPPLLWAYRILLSGIPWRAEETASVIMSLSVSAFALFGVALIRRGRFQWAIRQTLALLALVMILSYALEGTSRQGYEQPLAVVWMVLAGLMVGRRALWLMYACVLAAFVAGGFVDAGRGNPIDTPMNVTISIVISATIFLLIAIVIDRSVRALRESLADANRRGDALASANRRLEAEMAEREKVQQQLVHAQKVEAVGRLASGVAHDFNHLLSLILGYAAKGRRLEDAAELKKALEGVEAAGRRATAVTQKLLSFGRREAARSERFDLGEAMRDLQPMLRQLFDPDVRIVYDVPATVLPIQFDRAQFDLVVISLAANANDAMPDGGRFEVTLRASADGAHAELSLRDSGHGFGEDVRARLFEPFFTTKPAGRGTGLGLSVAHDLVRAAGGCIAVDAAPGQGALFRIVLPLAERALAEA